MSPVRVHDLWTTPIRGSLGNKDPRGIWGNLAYSVLHEGHGANAKLSGALSTRWKLSVPNPPLQAVVRACQPKLDGLPINAPPNEAVTSEPLMLKGTAVTIAFPPVNRGVRSMKMPVKLVPFQTMPTTNSKRGQNAPDPGAPGKPHGSTVGFVWSCHTQSMRTFPGARRGGLLGMGAAKSIKKMNCPSLSVIDALTMS